MQQKRMFSKTQFKEDIHKNEGFENALIFNEFHKTRTNELTKTDIFGSVFVTVCWDNVGTKMDVFPPIFVQRRSGVSR